ncbi:UvrB/UvrC motif-containing protein [Stackebrandtia albiflava]|uniref:UvrB/UvrC motif-containing protein n=1 Tax=Stackebrandtia albiflava TaxID=406432 RepID=A0A562URG3_9ACTN|nr:Clp protease N-terminal domain-containing protein [Stackebrandtia albiflava]TWJ08212.1 UvrB/UvrC motif-containing protein [Stackebrandtia albiflava]
MFERFTDRAQRVIVMSQEEARSLRHRQIGTEHLLLAMLREGEGVAATSLQAHGFDYDRTRADVTEVNPRGEEEPPGHIPFTPRAKTAIEMSLRAALALGKTHVGTEHLLLGVLNEGGGVAASIITRAGVEPDAIRGTVAKRLGVSEVPTAADTESAMPAALRDVEPYLRDLNHSSHLDAAAPVIGREAEIDRTIRVLLRRSRCNAVLVGERGVGKSAVVDGVAATMATGSVPPALRTRYLVDVDLDRLAADTADRSGFDTRLRQILEALGNAGEVVVHIEDADRHLDLGPNPAPGTVAALFWSLVARRRIQVILSMSPPVHRRLAAPDSHMDRHFVPIPVPEPSVMESVEILTSLRRGHEDHHGVTITDAAIQAAVRLTDRYVDDRFLPAKAVDLIDDCCAQVGLGRLRRPRELVELDAEIIRLRTDKEALIEAQDFARAAVLREKEKEAITRRAQWERIWEGGQSIPMVTAQRRELDELDSRIAQARETKETAIEAQDFESAAVARDVEKALIVARERVAQGQTTYARPVVTEELVVEVLAATTGIPPTEIHVTEEPPMPAPTVATGSRARLPVRSASSAILLGTAGYTDPGIPDIPGVVNNITDLAARLADPENGGFDPARVHTFPGFGWETVPEILEVAEAATDTLLMYFAGHGFVEPDGELYLGLTGTVAGRARHTAWPYDRLRGIMRDSPAANKLVVLDCCYAGRAIDTLSGDSGLSGQLDVSGSYVLTATSATRLAHAPHGDRNSAFTAALLHLLRQGLDDGGEFLRVAQLFPHVSAYLAARGKPAPQQRGTDTVGDLALSRNPRWKRPSPDTSLTD